MLRASARAFVGSYTPTAIGSAEVALAELTRAGLDYPTNPYESDDIVGPRRCPHSAAAMPVTFNPDAAASFEASLAIVLAGIRHTADGEQE